MAALALAAILSACGGSKLAKELTPIPTLPPGTEPALVDALQGATATQTASAGGQTSQADLMAMGKDIFTNTCSGCHGAQDGPGPAFIGMAERAATRIPGTSAADYIHQSIVDPSAYVVQGFNDIMPKNFSQQFSDQQINALVAYIIADSGGGGGTATPAAAPESTQEATPTSQPTEQAQPTSQPTEQAQPTSQATEQAQPTEQTTPAALGDPAAGEELFATHCSPCHGDQNGAGPARVGIAERAATRIPGMSAADYIHQSIVDPSAYVVQGFNDIMPKNFSQQFSAQEINDLVAYLLTQ
jgi:mono/diheme cytochrome c family protein